MNRVISSLRDDEFKEIQELYEKKIALENLLKIIEPENDALKEKFISDYGFVLRKFQEWWTKTSKKYEWEQIAGFNWSIDFDNQEVFLVEEIPN
jgi:CXXX repeat modification system protein